jgi:hypothetical protein
VPLLLVVQLSAAISSASTNVQSINRLFTLIGRPAAPVQSLSLHVARHRLSRRFLLSRIHLVPEAIRIGINCRSVQGIPMAISRLNEHPDILRHPSNYR